MQPKHWVFKYHKGTLFYFLIRHFFRLNTTLSLLVYSFAKLMTDFQIVSYTISTMQSIAESKSYGHPIQYFTYCIRKSITVWVFVVPWFLEASIREISYIKANAMVNIGKGLLCSPPIHNTLCTKVMHYPTLSPMGLGKWPIPGMVVRAKAKYFWVEFRWKNTTL